MGSCRLLEKVAPLSQDEGKTWPILIQLDGESWISRHYLHVVTVTWSPSLQVNKPFLEKLGQVQNISL